MSVASVVLRSGVRDLARNRWVVAYAAGFFVVGEALFWFGGTGAQVVLSLLNIVLVVVPLRVLAAVRACQTGRVEPAATFRK